MMKLFAGLILMVLNTMVLYCTSPCASETVPNPRLVNFLHLLAGEFSNIQEVSEDVQNKEAQVHNVISVKYIPAQVPILPSSFTFLSRESMESKLHRLIIFLVSLESDGVIRMKSYRINNMEQYTFDTPETEIIAELKEGDLTEMRKECDTIYLEIEPNVFFGTYPDCLDYSTNPENYYFLFTCNAFSAYPPFKAQEKTNPRPYTMYLKNRYSLSPFSDILGDISSFKDPCVC